MYTHNFQRSNNVFFFTVVCGMIINIQFNAFGNGDICKYSVHVYTVEKHLLDKEKNSSAIQESHLKVKTNIQNQTTAAEASSPFFFLQFLNTKNLRCY